RRPCCSPRSASRCCAPVSPRLGGHADVGDQPVQLPDAWLTSTSAAAQPITESMEVIDQDRFLAAATRVGIDTAPAHALYAELFPPQAERQESAVIEAGYAAQPTLSRLVLTLLYAGIVL